MKKCKHKGVIVTQKIYINAPRGYEVAGQKPENITDEETTAIFCEDCGEYLD
jgi:hypothetical protein